MNIYGYLKVELEMIYSFKIKIVRLIFSSLHNMLKRVKHISVLDNFHVFNKCVYLKTSLTVPYNEVYSVEFP